MHGVLPLALPALVVAAAMVVLLADVLFVPAGWHPRGRALGALTGLLLAGVLVASFVLDPRGSAARGAYVGGAWTVFFDRLFLVAGLLGVLGAAAHLETTTPRRQGEYYLLLLLSLSGMMLLPGTRDLLLLVIAFELMGIPLYVLAAWAKTDAAGAREATASGKSPAAEAAVKLYLVGATSTAITLFGLSFVVGATGSTRLAALAAAGPLQPLTAVGLLLVLAGLAFKIGLVPFHMWVPDTYQGASTPFVAFLSTAPKAAGTAAVIVVFVVGLQGRAGAWVSALVLLAAATMVVGNVLAVPQTDVRRLLAYSGVAQMGYVLVAVATRNVSGMGMAAFYLAAYVFTNMGAFFVVHAVTADGASPDLAGMAGLSRRSPWLGAALLLFLLSLAGIPFVVGFWAKLYVFLAAFRAGLIGLVVVGAVFAVVGLFYYMQVARAAFMTEPTRPERPRGAAPLRAAIVVCLLAVTGLGLWPRPLIASATQAGVSLIQHRSAH